MNRASPVSLRKAMEAATAMKDAGIMFVCMPVVDEADMQNLASQAQERFERLIVIAEAREGKA